MSSDDVLCNGDLGFMPAMPYTGENFGTDADFEPDAVPAAEDEPLPLALPSLPSPLSLLPPLPSLLTAPPSMPRPLALPITSPILMPDCESSSVLPLANACALRSASSRSCLLTAASRLRSAFAAIDVVSEPTQP